MLERGFVGDGVGREEKGKGKKKKEKEKEEKKEKEEEEKKEKEEEEKKEKEEDEHQAFAAADVAATTSTALNDDGGGCSLAELLTAPNFPTKVGGRPAWLDFDRLPTEEQLTCTCGSKLRFLLQVYSGELYEGVHNYHRSVFVFICPNVAKCNNPGRHGGFDSVLRFTFALLPYIVFNDVQYFHAEYAFDEDDVPQFKTTPTCMSYCMYFSANGDLQIPIVDDSACAKCHQRFYCSRDHQRWHWQRGHKDECFLGGNSSAVDIVSLQYAEFLFPEHLIILEPCEESQSGDNEEDDSDDGEDDLDGNDVSEIYSSEDGHFQVPGICKGSSDLDPLVRSFKQALNDAPDQVLRYKRGGTPVWIGPRTPDQKDIPPCLHCGSAREFEFQILPQILPILEVPTEEADFGVLAVYSCRNSCLVSKCAEEVIWHNPVSYTTTW
eukprot:gene9111-1413_t